MSIPTDTVTQPDVGGADEQPSDQRKTTTQSSLYRMIWRWHFYAGVIVTPVLFVMAVTGALYVFKEELERYFYADTVLTPQQGERVPLQDQIDVAEAVVPGMKANTLVIYDDPERATELRFFNREKNLRVFVNPCTAEHQGTIDRDADFFPVVLKIHRSLFAGTFGRVLTELTTSWAILLFITGVYLWWPRRSQGVWGVWWPRTKGKTYTVLRDLHTVPGFYMAIFALLIAVTGLFFSFVWGRAFVLTAQATKQIPSVFVDRPKSQLSTAATTITPDQASAIGRKQFPEGHMGLILPKKPTDSYGVFVIGEHVTIRGVMAIDRYTGAELEKADWSQFPPMFQARTFAYTIHVGSIFGLPTKILAVLTCVVIIALSITGVWMWLERRPRGRTGFPRYTSDMRVPPWLIAVIVVLSIFLPVAGISLVVILLFDWLIARFRAWRTPQNPTVA